MFKDELLIMLQDHHIQGGMAGLSVGNNTSTFASQSGSSSVGGGVPLNASTAPTSRQGSTAPTNSVAGTASTSRQGSTAPANSVAGTASTSRPPPFNPGKYRNGTASTKSTGRGTWAKPPAVSIAVLSAERSSLTVHPGREEVHSEG